jgi:hypothetical protein
MSLLGCSSLSLCRAKTKNINSVKPTTTKSSLGVDEEPQGTSATGRPECCCGQGYMIYTMHLSIRLRNPLRQARVLTVASTQAIESSCALFILCMPQPPRICEEVYIVYMILMFSAGAMAITKSSLQSKAHLWAAPHSRPALYSVFLSECSGSMWLACKSRWTFPLACASEFPGHMDASLRRMTYPPFQLFYL